MRPRGLHLHRRKEYGIIRTPISLKLSPSTPTLEHQMRPNVPIDRGITTGTSPIDGSSLSWGEHWRYDDPLHFIGALPLVGIGYRFVVVSGSYLLDLSTWERQGIANPLSMKDEPQPGWLHVQTAW